MNAISEWCALNRRLLAMGQARAYKVRGMSLLELVVSMGLLGLIMLPVIGLLGTSLKVWHGSNGRMGAAYVRQAALDGASMMIQGSTNILSVTPTLVDLRLANGTQGRLEYSQGRLLWTVGGATQVLAEGLTSARFTATTVGGARPFVGQLLNVQVASRAPTAATNTWSVARIWIRPSI